METKGNTNRVQTAAAFIEDTRVILYKKPGPAPESHLGEFLNMSYILAKDEDDAAGLVSADGWHRTAAEAEAAFKKAKPTAPVAPEFTVEVQKMLDDLKGAKKTGARIEYANGLGVDVRGMNEADALAAIGAALSKA